MGILEVLAKFPRFKGVAQNNRLILGLVAAASVTAASLGWMLSQAGGYDPQLLPLHKWTGFAVAATCTLAWLLNCRGWPRAYQISLLATLVVLVVASHLGASITHGRDFLTQFAPGPLRALLGGNGGGGGARHKVRSDAAAFVQWTHSTDPPTTLLSLSRTGETQGRSIHGEL